MKKILLNLIKLITLLAVVIVAFLFVYSEGILYPYLGKSVLAENSDAKLQWITTEGNKLVTEDGKEIFLHGVNLGGWLLQEYWMCPVYGDPEVHKWSNLETLQVLESRFTEEEVQKLMDTYQDNWITELDIINIAKAGANVVRVPFWYRNFMKDEKGTWITENLDDNPGIKRLDWIIEMAEKYGLYVILDMHGCPGGQTKDHVCGSRDEYRLFSDEECLETMDLLWDTLSDRYKDTPVVAAYDIMNEPMVYEYCDFVMDDVRNQVYDRMIKVIRKNDEKHIITVEGIWWIDTLPLPEESGWENILYQVHMYSSDMEEGLMSLIKYSEAQNIPIYIGEYADNEFRDLCMKYGVSNTSWSYKGMCTNDPVWFWYQCSNRLLLNRAVASVVYDSYSAIKFKWGLLLRTEGPFFHAN